MVYGGQLSLQNRVWGAEKISNAVKMKQSHGRVGEI